MSEEEKERNIFVWEKHQFVASQMLPTGYLTSKPGMCPDWKLNQQPFRSQAGTQSTEPHQPGLKLYFINYASTVFLIFFPLPPPPSTPHSLRQSPHHCSCSWVMRIRFLATPFPILYLHPHGYSVTTYLYFLIPSRLHPFPCTPSHLATIKMFCVSMILFLFLFA